jgi:Ran GTPase-activating protein (RanGAP) involved in mRNA processing and transport
MVLKDPMPKKLFQNSISGMLENLSASESTLKRLTLSNLGFDSNTIFFLSKALNSHPCIEQLDISSNNLSSKQIDMFLHLTNDNLKSLNISYNSGSESVESLSTYLHRSMKLVHLDMSGLGIKMDGLLALA